MIHNKIWYWGVHTLLIHFLVTEWALFTGEISALWISRVDSWYFQWAFIIIKEAKEKEHSGHRWTYRWKHAMTVLANNDDGWHNMKYDPTLESYGSVLWLLPAPPSGQEQTGTLTRTLQYAYKGHDLQVRLENKMQFYSYSFCLNYHR